jgi:cobalt-zinc-cadmium efflux system protein
LKKSQNHHDHSHGEASDQKRIGYAFVIICGFIFIEVAGGLFSGSLALIADAGHMVSDSIALATSWIAIEISKRAADSARTYGYKRAEVLAAFLNGCTLIVITIWIVIEALLRFAKPAKIEGGLMLGVAIAGMLSNLWAFFILNSGNKERLNMKSAWLHILGDLLGFVVAILAAIVIILTGWTPIDPLLSLIVAGLILKSAFEILKSSTQILLEGTPPELDIKELEKDLSTSIARLGSIHHLHVWSLTSEEMLLTLHARCRSGIPPSKLMGSIKQRVRDRFGIHHMTIQIDPEDCDEEEHILPKT